MRRFVPSPRLIRPGFLRGAAAVRRGHNQSHEQGQTSTNTDTKVFDADGNLLLERSTEEVRRWKEDHATESEADVKADRGEIHPNDTAGKEEWREKSWPKEQKDRVSTGNS